MTYFSWLHLTDFHQGMNDQNWLWPNFRERFLSDLESICEQWGRLDLVLFTGDLTQRGNAEEFNNFDELLNQLWELFAQFNFSPQFLAVPGNHDLVRPDETDPSVMLLRQWSDDYNPETRQSMQQQFWNNPESPYRQVVTQAFENYVAWWGRQNRRPEIFNTGILPGDFSATIEKDEAKLGILGLNTSFLQLTEGNYERRLAIHPRQFHHACNDDGPAWAREHHACLLLTHHPPTWLNDDSIRALRAEITNDGRFAIHLCGHMHEAVYQDVAEGGADARRLWQGRSLFGLEHYNGQTQRSHGYTVGRIELRERRNGALMFFPREGREQQGGQRKIVPDYYLDLTNYFPHTRSVRFRLLRNYEGSYYEGQDFDINACRNLVTQISQQHERLKQWKNLHEQLQLLSVRLRSRFIEEIDWWRRSQDEQRYIFIYKIVTQTDPQLPGGWRYFRDIVTKSIDDFKTIISEIEEGMATEEGGNSQEWIDSKRVEYKDQSSELVKAYSSVQELIDDWLNPQHINDNQLRSLLERLNDLATKIDNCLIVVDGNLKEQMSFFETYLQSLNRNFGI